MAILKITDFSLEILSRKQVRVRATYKLTLSETELRLEIPVHVWLMLMERDKHYDHRHVHFDWTDSQEAGTEGPWGNDDYGGWIGSRTHDSNVTAEMAKVFNRKDLPGETRNEEWYVAGKALPDIRAYHAKSKTISLNLA